MIGIDVFCGSVALGAVGDRVLKRGVKGDDVKALQQALTAAGFDTKGIDGNFGRDTESALKAFQTARGLEADGKAWVITFAALGLLGAPPVSAAAQAAVDAAGAGAPSPVTAAVAKEAASGDPAQAKQAAAQAGSSAAAAAASGDPAQTKQAAAQVQAAAANAPPAVQQQAKDAAAAAAAAKTPDEAAAAAEKVKAAADAVQDAVGGGDLLTRPLVGPVRVWHGITAVFVAIIGILLWRRK